jgi:hypothetical protein
MNAKIALSALLWFCVLSASAAAQPLKKITFSAKGGGEAMLPFVISERLGFYREEGFQSEVVVTTAKPNRRK